MRKLLVISLFLCSAGLLCAQTQCKPTVTWIRTDFENGVVYDGDHMASLKNEWEIDNLHTFVNFDDGTPKAEVHNTAQQAKFPTPASVYYIPPIPGHKYTESKEYHPVITTVYHCSHMNPGDGTFDAAATVKVHDRTPLNTIQAPDRVTAGKSFSVQAISNDTASKAGIRIDLTLEDHDKIATLPSGAISIPPGRKVTTFSITTKKVRHPTRITISASTIGRPFTKTVTVVP